MHSIISHTLSSSKILYIIEDLPVYVSVCLCVSE